MQIALVDEKSKKKERKRKLSLRQGKLKVPAEDAIWEMLSDAQLVLMQDFLPSNLAMK